MEKLMRKWILKGFLMSIILTSILASVALAQPVVNFVPSTPPDGSEISADYLVINATGTSTENVSMLILNWDGTNYTMYCSGNISMVKPYEIYNNLTMKGLKAGVYTYKVYANDTASNWGVSEERTVRIKAVPTASIKPESQEVMAGEDFTFKVYFDPAGNGLTGGTVTIEFNASVMEVNSAADGDLFTSYYKPQDPKIDNTNGTVIFEAVSGTGKIYPPAPAGNFTVITATVKADAPDGDYDLSLIEAGFGNDSGLPISDIAVENGTVTVGMMYPRWDVTEDGKVDIWDLMKVAAHYGEEYAEPPYPRWDVTEDGKVDIWDLMKVAAHYGEEY